jgi:iron(III) transport system ATP-binding protein
VGTTNFIDAEVRGHGAAPGEFVVDSGIGQIAIASAQPARIGEQVVLSVRPEDVVLSDVRPQGLNVFEGVVQSRAFLGGAQDFHIRVGTEILRTRTHPGWDAEIGRTVFLSVDPKSCVAIAPNAA